MRRIASALLIVLALTAGLAHAAGPSADAIFARLKQGFAGVNDYRADVSLTIKGPNVSINGMRMTMYFKKPNKIHIEAAQGMAMIPPGGFLGNPINELAAGARPIYLGSERKLGRDCHVLKLANPGPNSKMPPVTLWVDKEHTVMVAMEMSGEMGVTSSWRYEKIGGKYYLPAEISAEMCMPGGRNAGQRSKATINFTNYRVNKGISDKVFQEKPKK